ncbi:AAA family ATPase [Micrococcus luteus]|uniref:AAA family ATPase n=1 Tax=Micrococcus luteus TaxID=1270 RepID=UPI0037BC476A
MLKSVEIKNFKSIRSATLELSAVNVLVGPNNSGKSSALQAIQFAVSVAQSLSLFGVGRKKNEIESRAGTLAPQQLIYSPLRDVDGLAYGGTLKQQGDPISVTFRTDDLGDSEVIVKKGKNKNVQVTLSGKTLGPRLEVLASPFSVFAPGLAGIPAEEAYQSGGVVQRAAARGDANSVFRNVLLSLSKDAAGWREFEDSLAKIFPDVKVYVSFDPASDEHISVTAARGSGRELPIEASGTGVLQAVQVLSYVGLYKPSLLILDEPDAHLHPDNQRKLAQLLVEIADERDFQVFLSTHSRHMLDELGSLGAKIFWMSGGSPTEDEFDLVSALLELGALDAGDRLRNGKVPVVIITEDQKTGSLRALVESSGLNRKEFEIWSYPGSSQTAAAVVLAEFIAQHAPGTKVVIHRDRDYLTDEMVNDFSSSVKGAGAIPFITSGTDIESHFVNVDHLKMVYKELSEDQLTRLMEKAMQEVRPKSLEIMITERSRWDERERRKEGKSPNPGGVAAACAVDFDKNPHRYCHGKRTLKALRKLIVSEHQIDRDVATVSTALSVPLFEEVKNSLDVAADDFKS